MERRYPGFLSSFLMAISPLGHAVGGSPGSGPFSLPAVPSTAGLPALPGMARRRRDQRRPWDGIARMRGLFARRADAEPIAGETQGDEAAWAEEDEARFRLAVEAADFGVFEWEVLRDVEYWSDRLKALFDLPPETRMDESRFWPLVHPEDRAMLREALDEAISPEGDGRLRCRYRALRRGGGERWIELHGRTRFRDVGGVRWPMRLFGVARDVTGERAVEEAVRAAKEAAERANLAKTSFLATASHDLRQPVQSLVLLAHVIAGHVDPAGRNMLAGLQLSVGSLKDLLDALLDISKLDAGAMTPDVRPFALPGLFAELAGYAGLAEERGLHFRISGCDVAVSSDPVLLGRILRNLVENAIKFTERGGVEVTCRDVGERIGICVADTGIGIPPEHHDAVFGEFYQIGGKAGRPVTGGAKGLGLGLAIVKRLSELLGHDIGLESRPGEGTRFVVSVPRAEAAELLPEGPGEPAVRLGRGEARPLVAVLAEGPTADALAAAFRSWEADVVAGASVEALPLPAGTRMPDLAVIDDPAGGADGGIEALSALRRRFGAGLSCILLTAGMGNGRPEEGRGFAVLHKPVLPEELLRTAAARLERDDLPQGRSA